MWNNSISKIHINNSTNVSLNDRFTAFKKIRSKSPIQKIRLRRGGIVSQASDANKKLISRFNMKHKANVNKNRNLRRRVKDNTLLPTIRQIVAPRQASRRGVKSNVGYSTANLRRSKSKSNIVSRLGINGRLPNKIRMPQNGNNQNGTMTRNSRSRVRNVPMNTQNRNRSGSRSASAKRNSSLNRNRSSSRNSRSANRNLPVHKATTLPKKRFTTRSGLQVKPRNMPTTNTNFVNANRNQNSNKHKFNRRNVARKPILKTNVHTIQNRKQLLSNSKKNVVGKRLLNRTRNQINRNTQNNQKPQDTRRSRSRTRVNRAAPSKSIKKEDLDKELDQYMATSKVDM